MGVASLQCYGYTLTPNQSLLFSFAGTNPNSNLGLAGTARFQLNAGGQLDIVVTNTATAAAKVPTDVLTGIFFNAATLTKSSAILTSGSTLIQRVVTGKGKNATPSIVTLPSPTGGNVGGEWSYGSPVSGAPVNTNSAISSSGLAGNSPFPGPDLDGKGKGKATYGLVSDIDLQNANGGITDGAFAKKSVTFSFTGAGSSFSFSDVWFQYGTSTSEPSFKGSCSSTDPICNPPVFDPVPEPSFYGLLGAGVAGLMVLRARRKSA